MVFHHEVPVGFLPGCDFPEQCWILPVSPLVHGVLLVGLEALLGSRSKSTGGLGSLLLGIAKCSSL